jgi:hypothetical protein
VGGLHDALWVGAGLAAAGAVACWALLRRPAGAPAPDAEPALEAEPVLEAV